MSATSQGPNGGGTGSYLFTRKERERIIRDLARWKQEYEIGNDTFGTDEFTAYVEMCREQSDRDLKHLWETHVGGWILSRDDLYDAYENSDAYLESQFECLLRGGTTDYGFVVSVTLPPRV